MHIPIPTLLTTILTLPLSAARIADSTIACLKFHGFVGSGYQKTLTAITTNPNPNVTITPIPFNITASLQLASDPVDPSTLQEICFVDVVMGFPLPYGGIGLTCLDGYQGRFFWDAPDLPYQKASFITPTFPGPEPTDVQPGFELSATVLEDGSGTVYKGGFGCDGLNDTITVWTGIYDLL